MSETFFRWDNELLIWINNLATDKTDSFWLGVTNTLVWFPLFLFIVILFFVYFDKNKAILASMFFGGTGFLVLIIKEITKQFFKRLRPCNVEELADSLRILTCKDSFSFFSGHASFSFAIITFTVLVLRHKTKWIYLTWIFPLLFATSRMITGVHFPSDIIVGAIIGALVGILMHSLLEKDWVKLPSFVEKKLKL